MVAYHFSDPRGKLTHLLRGIIAAHQLHPKNQGLRNTKSGANLELRSEIAHGTYENQNIMLHDKNRFLTLTPR